MDVPDFIKAAPLELAGGFLAYVLHTLHHGIYHRAIHALRRLKRRRR